jgi:hypothetical protein
MAWRRRRREATFRAVVPEDANPELLDEELKLFSQLVERLKERLPEGASDERLGDFLPQASAEDPEIAAIANRLDDVMAANKGSVIRSMWDADRKAGRA